MAMIHHVRYTASGDASSHTVTFDGPAVAGNTIVVIATSSAAITIPSGYARPLQSLSGMDMSVLTKTATGGETSVVLAVSASRPLIADVWEYDDLGAPGVTTTTFTSKSTTDYQVSPLTPTVNSYVFAAVGLSPQDVAFGTTWYSPMVGTSTASSASGSTDSISHSAAVGYITAGTPVTPGVAPGSSRAAEQFLGIAFAKNATTLGVSAGNDQSIYVGATATLTAAATGGAGTVSYVWSKLSGPTGTFSTTAAASTVFTPSGGAGTYNLRVTATDSLTSISDDVVITVNAVPVSVAMASVTTSTGWTVTPSGTVLAAISDSSSATFITSTVNPTNQVLDVISGVLAPPAVGQSMTFRVECRKNNAASGTIQGQLYHGTTLYSTKTVNIPDTFSFVDIVFPATDISTIPSGYWADMRLVLSVTSS